MTDPAVAAVAARFVLPGPVQDLQPVVRGHINDTFRLQAGGHGFALQRLNTAVFPEPQVVFRNRVQLQLCQDLAGLRLVPPLLPTVSGALWHEQADGAAAGWWRLCPWVAGSCHDRLPDAGVARAAGVGFARLHGLLADLPGDLGTPIAGFLDLRQRLAALQAAANEDSHGRAVGVAQELDLLAALAPLAALMDGQPIAVLHGDCKVNNLVFGADGAVAAVLDLDTLMPGVQVLDLGDLLRSGCALTAEDQDGPAGLDSALWQALLAGYASVVGPERWRLLAAQTVPAVLYVTTMLAARFLTDWLQGDRYFRPRTPGRNLARTRACLGQVAAVQEQAGRLALLAEAAGR